MAGHRHQHGSHSADRDQAWSVEEALALLSRSAALGVSPESLWDRVGLKTGRVVADVGAGAGRFAFPAARRVGPSGRVYAVDISEALVGWLGTEARRGAMPQLVPVRNTPERIPLNDGLASVVLLANVLHDISEPTAREAVRLLADDGTFVNLDWKKEDMPEGPPLEVRLSPGEATRQLQALGLKAIEEWDAGPYHYAIRFRRALGRAAHPRRP